jgi:nucleoside-diphosphate-sugar epimerase
MRVLVTGATGFVGAAVVRTLLRQGTLVLGLVRDADRGDALRRSTVAPQRLRIAVGDMWRPETYGPLVAEVDAVIHAAQQSLQGRWTSGRIRAMHESDALMTRTLASACLQQQKLLIYTSGALAHVGEGEASLQSAPDSRPCRLALGHANMVRELLSLHRERGLGVRIVSPGFVYGAGSFLQLTAELLLQGRYRIIGDGRNLWSLVHVDDLAQVYVAILDRGQDGRNYFIGDDAPLPRKDVINQVSDALGVPRVGHVPQWLAGALFGFPMVEALCASAAVCNQTVKDELGWRPRYATFAAGLPDAISQLIARREKPHSNGAARRFCSASIAAK